MIRESLNPFITLLTKSSHSTTTMFTNFLEYTPQSAQPLNITMNTLHLDDPTTSATPLNITTNAFLHLGGPTTPTRCILSFLLIQSSTMKYSMSHPFHYEILNGTSLYLQAYLKVNKKAQPLFHF